MLCLVGAGAGYYVLTGERPSPVSEEMPARKAGAIRIGPIADMPDIRDGVPALMPAKTATARAPSTQPPPAPAPQPAAPQLAAIPPVPAPTGGLLAPGLLGQPTSASLSPARPAEETASANA